MKFSTREDLEAPVHAIFAALSDFEAYERLGTRRGVQVRRMDGLNDPGEGTQWELGFDYRGKPRIMTAELIAYVPPEAMRFRGESRAVNGLVSVDLTRLSRSRTRVRVELEVQPRTLSAKIFVQSLRLAKSRVNDRYKTRVKTFLKDLEARLHKDQ